MSHDGTTDTTDAQTGEIAVSDLTLDARLRAPEGDLCETDGGVFVVQDYNIHSGLYTLSRVGSKYGTPNTLKVRKGSLLAHWKRA